MAGKFEGEAVLPEPYDERSINVIRGKSLLWDDEQGRDARYLCRMIDWFVEQLEELDYAGAFGEDGWRVRFGLEVDDE